MAFTATCIPINEPAFQDLSTLAPPYPLVSSPAKEFLSIYYLGVCSSEYCLSLPSWPPKLSADPSTWVNFTPTLKPLLPSPGHIDFFLSQRLLALIPDPTPHIRTAVHRQQSTVACELPHRDSQRPATSGSSRPSCRRRNKNPDKDRICPTSLSSQGQNWTGIQTPNPQARALFQSSLPGSALTISCLSVLCLQGNSVLGGREWV